MKRMGFTQKRTLGAVERDEFLRAAWKVMVAEQVEAKRLVFVDEMGTSSSLSTMYAWAPREGLLICASQPGTQHDAAFEHERGRDGAFSSRGGYDHRRDV